MVVNASDEVPSEVGGVSLRCAPEKPNSCCAAGFRSPYELVAAPAEMLSPYFFDGIKQGYDFVRHTIEVLDGLALVMVTPDTRHHDIVYLVTPPPGFWYDMVELKALSKQ